MTKSVGSFYASFRSAPRWAAVGLAFAVVPCEIMGADPRPSPGSGTMHFVVQDNGSIEDGVATLGGRLGLSDEQRARVVTLMRERAGKLKTRQTEATESFRTKVEALLTERQCANVPWPALSWSAVSDWTGHIKDLNAEQAGALGGLLKQRRAAIWTALTGVQKTYADGLKSMLTAEQQKKLTAMAAEDPLVCIPMR